MKKIREAALFDKLEVWENSDHPVQINAEHNENINEHLKEIHNNPVRNKIVALPQDYLHSSARNYVGLKGLVNIQHPKEKNEPDISIYAIPAHNTVWKKLRIFFLLAFKCFDLNKKAATIDSLYFDQMLSGTTIVLSSRPE